MNDFELLKRDHSTEHFPKHNQSQCRVCSLIKHHDQVLDQLTVSESDNDKMFDEGYNEGWADALEGEMPSPSSQMAQEARSKLERAMGLPEREVSAEGSTEAT